ncbi:GNAT family N-acetyltransferase [Microbacterium sp. NPDC055903]
MWELRDDDLTDADVQALVDEHLSHMLGQTPPESVHAVGVAALRADDVRFVVARRGGELGGMGAYRRMSAGDAELKSMRTTDAVRGTGLGRLLLRHLVVAAQAEGITTLWLETGSGAPFAAARGLYRSEGFVECPPFGDYTDDPESVYFRRDLEGDPGTLGR